MYIHMHYACDTCACIFVCVWHAASGVIQGGRCTEAQSTFYRSALASSCAPHTSWAHPSTLQLPSLQTLCNLAGHCCVNHSEACSAVPAHPPSLPSFPCTWPAGRTPMSLRISASISSRLSCSFSFRNLHSRWPGSSSSWCVSASGLSSQHTLLACVHTCVCDSLQEHAG